MSKLVKIAGSLVLVAGLVYACNSSSVEKVDTAKSSAPAPVEQKQEQKQTPETHNLKVGDTVKFNNLQITVNGVRSAQTFGGSKAAVIDVTVENVGEEPEQFSTLLSFELVDTEGVKMDVGLVEGAKADPSGEIAPGRKLRGEVAFDLKNAAGNQFDLIYSEPFSEGQAIWQIEVN